MSRETLESLNQNTLIGFTAKRGYAWHYRKGFQTITQETIDPATLEPIIVEIEVPNHYAGPVPVRDVRERLFAWEPVKVPEQWTYGETLYTSERDYVIIRSDTCAKLGTFKEGYQPHPYSEWLLDKVALILDDTLSIGSAGLLRAGAQAWVSVEVPENIRTPEGVQFRPHLLACTSLDGSLATTFKPVITNVVCDNTMALALDESGPVLKVKHSKRSLNRIADVRDALGIVHQVADSFQAQVRELCRTTVTNRQWQQFLITHTEIEDKDGAARTRALKTQTALDELWRGDARVEPWRNTAYGVIQCVNTHKLHEATVRGGVSRAERNMSWALSGDIDAMDQATYATLRKVLAAAV